MSSRFSAARPKRDGENFARTHHHDRDEAGAGDTSKVKFDVRNPSNLAPDAREEDAVLEADVIGGGAATKRGAVNLDGYDSDSDNETFTARADKRTKTKGGGDPNLNDQLDNYDSKGSSAKTKLQEDDDDEDDEDMFAVAAEADDDDDDDKRFKKADAAAAEGSADAKRKAKAVHFMENNDIKGQELHSKSGGHIRLDDQEGSSDSEDDPEDVEEARRLAAQEEGVDEEVGIGGLKRHAPKVEAFNMQDEQEEGRFDADGNFIRKAADPDAVHDKWMDGLSKKEIKKAADAHQAREEKAREQRMEEDSLLTTDILKSLIVRLERGETPLEALARLGKNKTKPKKVPKWKLKKQQAKEGEMDVDEKGKAPEEQDPEQAKIKEAIDAITDAADKLMSRDREEVYDEERELLIREWCKETGDEWLEPSRQQQGTNSGGDPLAETGGAPTMWEFRWVDGRDGADKQGPFDAPTMKAWHDAGYFGEGVEFRPAGAEVGWSPVANFL